MKRDIELIYALNEDKTIMTITLQEETSNAVISKTREFNLLELDEETLLYNEALDEFEAEYDDEVASMLDKLINRAIKEHDMNE